MATAATKAWLAWNSAGGGHQFDENAIPYSSTTMPAQQTLNAIWDVQVPDIGTLSIGVYTIVNTKYSL